MYRKNFFLLLFVLLTYVVLIFFHFKITIFIDKKLLEKKINEKFCLLEDLKVRIRKDEKNENLLFKCKNKGIEFLIINKNNELINWGNNDFISSELIEQVKVRELNFFYRTFFYADTIISKNFVYFFFIPFQKKISIINEKYEWYQNDFKTINNYKLVFDKNNETQGIPIFYKNNVIFHLAPILNYNPEIVFYLTLIFLTVFFGVIMKITHFNYSFYSLILILFYILGNFLVFYLTKDKLFQLDKYFVFSLICILSLMLIQKEFLKYIKNKRKIFKYELIFVLTILGILFAYLSIELIKNLIGQRIIDFSNLVWLSKLKNVFYFLLFALLITYIQGNIFLIERILKRQKIQYVYLISLLFLLIILILITGSYFFVLFVLPFGFPYVSNKIKYIHGLNDKFLKTVIIFVLIILPIVVIVLKEEKEKSKNELKVIAKEISSERNKDVEKVIISYLNSSQNKKVETEKLVNEILNYFEKYSIIDTDVRCFQCDEKTDLRVLPLREYYKCVKYFDSIINNFSIQKIYNGFYVIQDENAYVYYLIKLKKDKNNFYFIEIFLNNNFTFGVFNNFLSREKLNLNDKEVAIAKYVDGNLMLKKGEFDFPVKIKKSVLKENKHYKINNYLVYVYNCNNSENSYLVAKSFVESNIVIASFVLLFNFTLIIYLLYSLAFSFFKKEINFKSYKFKYLFSVIVTLVFASVLILIYNYHSYMKNFHDLIHSEIFKEVQSITDYLKEKYGKFGELFLTDKYLVNNDLYIASNVFRKEINLYDFTGKLFSTSRWKIYKFKLKPDIINPFAKKEIAEKEVSLVEEDLLGYPYLAVYKPLYEKGKYIGALNINFFEEKERLFNEIIDAFIKQINFFVFLLIFLILISLSIVKKVFSSLIAVERYFRNIRPELKYEPIVYKQKDEVYNLITEYNRVLKELSDKTKKLIETERIIIWKDIAKQIAHEIKNPLTPIKLKIQYLIKNIREGKYGMDIEKDLKSILEQIDILSEISRTFLVFSNLPQPKIEEVEVISLLNSLVTIYNNEEMVIKFSSKDLKKVYVDADKNFLIQIFNNLIKNSLEAIPLDREKNIEIEVQVKEKNMIVKISDNGLGIPEEIRDKIFFPKFSTKSSGMGLGLSIVKDMVKMLGGKIYFETQLNIGTTFYFELKCKRYELSNN